MEENLKLIVFLVTLLILNGRIISWWISEYNVTESESVKVLGEAPSFRRPP